MLRKWFDYLTIRRSGFFDSAYYLLSYPDCRRADVEPLWHFVNCGWREGRNPSSKFETEYYLRMNPDVRRMGINPLVHYLKHGRIERRASRPFQDVQFQTRPRLKRQGRLRGTFKTLSKSVFWRIPYRFRFKLLHWAYQNVGFLFSGISHYENWRNSGSYFQFDPRSNLIDIYSVDPADHVKGRIAIHIHIFYADLVKEFTGYLKNMPFPYDLFISVASDEAMGASQNAYVGLPFCQNVRIERVANRGRDIAPMFCAFGEELADYDYVAHLHTKKSLHNEGSTLGWREYMCQSLLGSQERIRRIFDLMQGDDSYGIVYPQIYVLVPYWANTWLANRSSGYDWCARLGIYPVPRGYFDFPVGSMFWARGDALAPLFQAGITLGDFPEEAGQNDGTLAHTLERLLGLSPLKQGMQPGIIKDDENLSWSSWRFNHYTGRMYQHMTDLLASPDVQLIAFDIFDTLFCRPLLDPESTKDIVARRLGGENGTIYREYRTIAEQQAREAKGSDVGLDEIYARLGELIGLSDTDLAKMRDMEEEVEKASLEPRWEALTLYRDALATGKPVIIISDMFLPRATIENILHTHEIDGWDAFYLSNEVGLRKDDGKLYEYVLAKHGKESTQMLMIGDNERSDVQIPTERRMSVIHLMRPVELARSLPRLSSQINSHENKQDLDAEITLGLVVRKNFAPIQFLNFDFNSLVEVTPFNLGYSILGPLLVSFSQWLCQKASEDGIDRFYFLSREGKPIKQIFDCWTEGDEIAPDSEYLVVSRRTAGFAAISTMDDILDIARTNYFPNTIESFLHTRYGLRLSDERWDEISASFRFDRNTIIGVQDRKIEPLIPLLQSLEPEIMERIRWERLGLHRYFSDKGLYQDIRHAVVDVGYGGSVQGYMNKLLSQDVHGYYMMTDERSAKIAKTYDVLLRGCFYENISLASKLPVMFAESFKIEKLLSTNEPQIEYYNMDDAGQVRGHHRDLLPEELACKDIRNQLLEGALEYTKDARQVRSTLLPDFQPSCWTAQMLVEAFLVQKSKNEHDLLSEIVLDDYYCGRDLVF